MKQIHPIPLTTYYIHTVSEVQEASDELGKDIALLDAPDVARFVIKYAPELLFDLDF